MTKQITSNNNLRVENLHETNATRNKRLKVIVKRVMRGHVGNNNPIHAERMFKEVFGVLPQAIDVYECVYLWNVISALIRELRRDGELFIIRSYKYLYILQSNGELEQFKARIDGTINALQTVKIRADEWIKKRKWKDFI